MQHVARIEMTPTLAETCGTTTPVWQFLLRDRAVPILRELGWNDFTVWSDEGAMTVEGSRGVRRRARLHFAEPPDGGFVDAFAATWSTFTRQMSFGVGALAGMAVFGFAVVNRDGWMAGLVGMAVVWVLVSLATCPLWWLIGKCLPLNAWEAEGYAAGLLEILRDDEAVAGAREALAARGAEIAARQRMQEISADDVEPEDHALSLDALERKYGLVKGGHVHAWLQAAAREDDHDVDAASRRGAS